MMDLIWYIYIYRYCDFLLGKILNIMQILGPAFASISGELRLQNILGDCKTSIQSVSYLCENKAVAAMVNLLKL